MEKVLLKTIIGGSIVVILAFVLRFGFLNKPKTVSTLTSSTLSQAIDIADLSTAEFRYRGIADVLTKKNKVYCRICYNAIVKAGIDMRQVSFNVDTSNKTVTAFLPNIDIRVSIIDEQSMAVLPSNAKIGLDSMLKYSREDAEKEARESEELMATARENLKATIGGLLFPILKAQGYSLNWK